jgi:hypothetical protein
VVTETFTGDPSQKWAMTDVASFPGNAHVVQQPFASSTMQFWSVLGTS